MTRRSFTPAWVLGMLFGAVVAALWFARPDDSAPDPPVPPPATKATEAAASAAKPPPRTPPTPLAPSPQPTASEDVEASAASSSELLRPDPTGAPLTTGAVEEPDMSEMDGGVAEYDARVEARQRFRDFELTVVAARPLTPEKWRVIQADRGEESLEILKRAKQLTDDGEPEAARELMEEWQRLTSLYKNEAYGRGRVLGAD